MDNLIKIIDVSKLYDGRRSKQLFAFVETQDGHYIISENDFCHAVYEPDGLTEPCVSNFSDVDHPVYGKFSLAQLRAAPSEEIPFHIWAHYWGIKHRVEMNYYELIRSMREYGCDTSTMPEWGARPEQSPAPMG